MIYICLQYINLYAYYRIVPLILTNAIIAEIVSGTVYNFIYPIMFNSSTLKAVKRTFLAVKCFNLLQTSLRSIQRIVISKSYDGILLIY